MKLTTSDEVKKIRDELGISLFEAVKIVKTKNLLKEIESADSIEKIKDILKYIVTNFHLKD